MQISLSTLPDASMIEDASLFLYITECADNGSSIRHRTNSSTATGLASQKLAGDVLITNIVGAPVNQWFEINVTDFIIADLEKGHSLAVFDFPSKSSSSLKFCSGEDTGGYAPYLSVTLIPEPASLGLFALSGLGLLKRKQRR